MRKLCIIGRTHILSEEKFCQLEVKLFHIQINTEGSLLTCWRGMSKNALSERVTRSYSILFRPVPRSEDYTVDDHDPYINRLRGNMV